MCSLWWLCGRGGLCLILLKEDQMSNYYLFWVALKIFWLESFEYIAQILMNIFQVVTALGKTYHQKCFTCARCRQPFPSGEKVTYTGKEVLCQKCVQIPIRDSTPKTSPATSPLPNGKFWYLNQLHHFSLFG